MLIAHANRTLLHQFKRVQVELISCGKVDETRMLARCSSASVRHHPFIALKRLCSSAAATAPVQHNQKHERPKQWSVIDDARKASKTIEALLRLPDDTPVAWSTQATSTATSPPMTSMCAYAGDSFEHGAYIYIRPQSTQESAVWALFREYFRDELTKSVCFDVRCFTNDLQSRGIRAHGRVHDVQAMIRMYGRQAKHIEACCESLLNKRTRDRRTSMFGDVSADEQSIQSCHADAHGIFHLYHDVAKRMRKKALLSNFANNTFEAYDKFYARVEKKLAEMGKQDLQVDSELMNEMKSGFEREGQAERAVFEKWAVGHCTDGTAVNLTSPTMLRHLLFAPYTNVHDKTQSVGAERTFSVRVGGGGGAEDGKGVKKGKAVKKRIVIRGAGLGAQTWTRNGVPSVSTSALQKVVSTIEKSDDAAVESACRAICALLKWQEAGRKWERFEKSVLKAVDNDGLVLPSTRIDFESGAIESNLSRHVYDVVRAKSGNELMVVELNNVKLCALAEVSGCEVLRARVAQGEALHTLLAREFSREIQAAVLEGHCVLNGGGGVKVSQKYPQKVRMARMLDWCMTRGGRLHDVKSAMGCDDERGRRLVRAWLNVHPGVRRWVERGMKGTGGRRVAETVCGQQRAVRGGGGKRAEARVAEGVAFAVSASARDVVLCVADTLWSDDLVRALGWRVALVDARRVALCGASHSAPAAIDAVRRALWRAGGAGVTARVMAQLRIARPVETVEQ